MKCNVHSENGLDVLEVSGEVDLQYSPKLREQILSTLKRKRSLAIDLGGVSYIDSSGLASLVEGLQAAKTARLSYGLTRISEPVSQVLALTRLDNVFPMFRNLDEFRAQVNG